VLSAVQFHDQFCRVTVEVRDVLDDRVLASEGVAAEAVGSQVIRFPSNSRAAATGSR
jgi:hypothetical protein